MTWLRRLFGKGDQARRSASESHAERITRAINDYGALMQTHPNSVLPQSYLPLPMDEMKAALLEAWAFVDDPRMRAMLETGYMHLAYFRSGVPAPTSLALSGTPTPEAALEALGPQLALQREVLADQSQLIAEFERFKALQV